MAFGLTDFRVRMPLFGLIARNAKNFQPGRQGWLNAEEKLCTAYIKYIAQISKANFLQRIEYMKHAGDLGRTPMGSGTKVFLFILVAAEAMGFSYLLGTWAASDGSANLYRQLMYGIVFVLASILAMVTHAAGNQFYRTQLIRACFKRYKEAQNSGSHSTGAISLAEDQFKDRDVAPETRCLNRIIENPGDMGSYGWTWVAVVFVGTIFVLSGTMRFSHMETEMTRQSQAADAQNTNPFAQTQGPSELTQPQQASDKKAAGEVAVNTVVEGGSAIIILGIIFVVTQIVGFGAGYKHSFAGRETYKTTAGSNRFWWWSEKDGAYADTWGYATFEAYWQAMQPYKDIVNSRLKELQQRLANNSTKNLLLTKTFDEFLSMQAEIARVAMESQNLTDAIAASDPRFAQSRPVAPHAQVGEAASSVMQTPSELTTFGSSQAITLDQAKASIEGIADKTRQQDYFASLPSEIRESLKPWLKERKVKATVVTKAELDELF